MKSSQFIFTNLLLDFPESELRIIQANNNFLDLEYFDGKQNLEFLKSASLIFVVKLIQFKNKKFILISSRNSNNTFISELIAVFAAYFKKNIKKEKNTIRYNETGSSIEFLDINNYVLKQDDEVEELIFYNCSIKNKLKFENDLEIISKGLSKIKSVKKINIK